MLTDPYDIKLVCEVDIFASSHSLQSGRFWKANLNIFRGIIQPGFLGIFIVFVQQSESIQIRMLTPVCFERKHSLTKLFVQLGKFYDLEVIGFDLDIWFSVAHMLPLDGWLSRLVGLLNIMVTSYELK